MAFVLGRGTINVDRLERFADGKFGEPAVWTYHVNLDERGYFYADVRNSSGRTVFEVKAGNSLDDPENETSIFDDGYMKHPHDMDGLKSYLVELGIMPPRTSLVDADNGRRASAVPPMPRMSRMVVAGSGVPVLLGSVDDARASVTRDGFNPSQMVVIAYAPEEVLAEPEFPTGSRSALTAHVARCKVSCSAMSEEARHIDPVQHITFSLGLGSEAAGWRQLMQFAARQTRGLP